MAVHSAEDVDRFLASFAGVDGGNPKAPVWVCGIEFGGGLDDLSESLQPQSLGSWDDKLRQSSEARRWQLHQKVAKLMTAIRSLRMASDQKVSLDDWRRYRDEELYSEGGDSFKLNLFPLSSHAVRDEDWDAAYRDQPVLSRKETYYEHCREKRFPLFASLRREHKPGVIVGIGVEKRADFATAFGFDPNKFEERTISAGGRVKTCYCMHDGGTTLIVSPFFDGRNLNSDALLVELARLVVQSGGGRA
jgi:transcriptional activator of eps genes